MYPNLYYAFKDLFGVDLPGLRFINSFGFFVAFAFLSCAYVLNRELRRKERAGLMNPEETKLVVGKPASAPDLILNFILGFLLGYKILGLFLADRLLTADPQAFIFSARGHWPAGLLLGGVFAFIKWMEKNRQRLSIPEERVIRIWPHDRVGDMVIFAAVFGFLGAKIFHNLENWSEFWKNPIEALLSFSGLTFYGGLICAAVAIYFYARKHRVGFRYLCDAIAPGLLLAYAVGRIGCQVSGDGDWGIINSAYVSTPQGKVVRADPSTFDRTLHSDSAIYLQQSGFSNIADIQHKWFEGPSWAPGWMIAYNFPHNVIGEGVRLPDCQGQYCSQLPLPVFPTSFYETVMGLILTAFLFLIRNRLTVPGTLFAVYLIVNGIERFLIEQIRVNTRYHFLGINPTQAELISFLLVLAGAALLFILRSKSQRATAPHSNV